MIARGPPHAPHDQLSRSGTSNLPTTFDFNSNTIRVITIDGEPWFVARDVYTVLELTQHGGILNPLSDDEKTKRGRTTLGMTAGRDMWVISESGLYKLIMRSDKPEARKFQDWVTREVLPTIRKTGGYRQPQDHIAYHIVSLTISE